MNNLLIFYKLIKMGFFKIHFSPNQSMIIVDVQMIKFFLAMELHIILHLV